MINQGNNASGTVPAETSRRHPDPSDSEEMVVSTVSDPGEPRALVNCSQKTKPSVGPLVTRRFVTLVLRISPYDSPFG